MAEEARRLPALREFSDVESVEQLPRKLTRREKAVAGDIVQLLRGLDEYDLPDAPVEQYLDARAGKYAVMLEEIVNVAAQLGLFDLARATLVDLLRMTKAGRAKVDLTTSGKLRDETSLKHLTDDVLRDIVAKPTAE